LQYIVIYLMKLTHAIFTFLLASFHLPACAADNTPATFLRAGTFDVTVMDYFMSRTFHSDPNATAQAQAIGGKLLYKTPYAAGFAAGIGVYTAQKMPFSPKSTDGSNVLAPGQKSFSVLGLSYLNYKFGNTELTIYRQLIDTPFINPNDIRIAPVTYEAYTVRNTSLPGLKLTTSQITKIKEWTSTEFISLPKAAGYDINKSVTMLGAEYQFSDDLKTQLWNYQAYDFLNTSYFQFDKTWKRNDWNYSLSGQVMAQTDTGKAIAGRIKSAMGGIMLGAGTHGANAQVAYTQAANGTDMVNPFAGFPGYTSIMEEDCDLDGQKAWLLGFNYDFSGAGLPGLYAETDYTQAYIPSSDDKSFPTQHEINFIMRYSFADYWKGLSVTFKTAYVYHSQRLGDTDYYDYRLITAYRF